MGNSTDKINYVGDTHMVMMGRVTPQLIMRTFGDVVYTDTINVVEVGSAGIAQAVDRVGADHENVGLISMDGLFCPYYIGQNGASHPNLPYWENPSLDGSGDVSSNKLNPVNQNKQFYNSGVFNSKRFYDSGHNILFQNNFTESGTETVGDLNPYKGLSNNEGTMEDMRLVGLKAPVVLTGWGYDTNGDPVPAQGTVDGKIFHPEAFRNPTLWKSGPLDVRWDNNRKVWAANGGGGSSTGSCCECQCIENGDITVDGRVTTSEWTVELGPIKDRQTNGYITLQRAAHTLLWSSGNNYWKAAISSGLFEARTYTGVNVTNNTPGMSGQLIFRRNDGDYTTLTLSIYGVVPTG